MRIHLTICLLLISLALPAMAEVGANPDQTLLWNRYTAVRSLDEYAIGITSEGVAVMLWDFVEGEFTHEGELFLDEASEDIRVYGDLAVIRTRSDSLILIDLGDLPDLQYRGGFLPEEPYADFAYDRNSGDLYLSHWFEGITRWTQPSHWEFQFADSSLRPILTTQLMVEEGYLMALDEYNGLLRYDLSSNWLDQPSEYLYTPTRTHGFDVRGDQIALVAINNGCYSGEFGHTGSGVTGQLSDSTGAERVIVADNHFAMFSDRFLFIYRTSDLELTRHMTASANSPWLGAGLIMLEGNSYLMLPNAGNGLLLINMETGDIQSAVKRPGPITSLSFVDGLLYTGGTANPIDVFRRDGRRNMSLEFTIHDQLAGVASMANNGDTLIALYAGPNKLAFITGASSAEEYYLESSISLRTSEPRSLEYVADWDDSSDVVFVTGKHEVSAYAIVDSAAVQYSGTWRLTTEIIDAAISSDSLLHVSNSKNLLQTYRILDDENLQYMSAITLATEVQELVVVGSHLVYFHGNKMHYLDYSNPASPIRDTSIELALPVYNSIVEGDRLLTIGHEGFAIYGFEQGYPELIEHGGRGGVHIAADSNVVATSNGGSLNLYFLGEEEPDPQPEPELPDNYFLSQNYPNPFNPITAIDFSLPEATDVSLTVYNLLGQKIVTLVNRRMSAGNHTVYWDASRDNGGRALATGVYLYRLEAGSIVASRKMLLLK